MSGILNMGKYWFMTVNRILNWLRSRSFGRTEFESYSELDQLGRCGVVMANLSPALMPTEERGSIGTVKPSGWHTVKYPELIEDNYLYNRCHLIAFSLAGENANKKI